MRQVNFLIFAKFVTHKKRSLVGFAIIFLALQAYGNDVPITPNNSPTLHSRNSLDGYKKLTDGAIFGSALMERMEAPRIDPRLGANPQLPVESLASRTVPESSTGVMMCCGLLGIGIVCAHAIQRKGSTTAFAIRHYGHSCIALTTPSV